MQTVKKPYELLVRWDRSGALAGAHVQHRYVIVGDDGAALGETLSPAEPLTLDTAAGFPLGNILTRTQTDALTAAGEADKQRDAALVALAQAQADRDEALARVASLEAELANLRPTP